MGITLKGIAAQRAMLAHGEEKRLRDEFAAAALTGLLSNIPRYQLGVIAVQAYDIADEMLRERLRNGAVKSRENEHYRGVEELGRPRRAHNPEIAGSNPAAPIHDGRPITPDAYQKNDENSGFCDTNREARLDALERLSALDEELERKRSETCPHIRGGVTRHCSLNFTLSDEEREAVRFFSQIDGPDNVPVANRRAATLRNLLERLK